jgi:threonine/homoserine/homoserine lactone efflux protein
MKFELCDDRGEVTGLGFVAMGGIAFSLLVVGLTALLLAWKVAVSVVSLLGVY